MEDFLLANNYTIQQYVNDIQEKTSESKVRISNFLKQRFLERYIIPGKSGNKNGFNIMASCCLLIETLESFYKGINETETGQGISSFGDFFKRFPEFKDFAENEMPKFFYKNIRCGILHQGETKDGWRIRRDNKNCCVLLDIENKKIDANLFRDILENAVQKYCDDLIILPDESIEWEMLEQKMEYVLKNCGYKKH